MGIQGDLIFCLNNCEAAKPAPGFKLTLDVWKKSLEEAEKSQKVFDMSKV